MPVDVAGIIENQDMMLELHNSMDLAVGRWHLFLGVVDDEQAQLKLMDFGDLN